VVVAPGRGLAVQALRRDGPGGVGRALGREEPAVLAAEPVEILASAEALVDLDWGAVGLQQEVVVQNRARKDCSDASPVRW
jgi:hypothetical protein